MRAIVDRAAFATDQSMRAALYKAWLEQPFDTIDNVDLCWPGTLRWMRDNPGEWVLVCPEYRRELIWGLALDPNMDPYRFFLRYMGLPSAKVNEVARKGRDSKIGSRRWQSHIVNARTLTAEYESCDHATRLSNYDSPLPHVTTSADRDYSLVIPGMVDHELTGIRGQSLVALDFETEGDYPLGLSPVGFSYSFAPGHARYVPLRHEGADNISVRDAHRILNAITTDPRREWIAHNALFEMNVLSNMGITPTTPHDTMILAWMRGNVGIKGLKQSAEYYLGIHMQRYEEVARGRPFSQVSGAHALAYGGADADITRQLYRKFTSMPEITPLAWSFYNDVERQLLPILLHMERRGVKVDQEWLARWGTRLGQDMDQSLYRLQDLSYWLGEATTNLTLSNDRHVARLLFAMLRLPPQRFTSHGYSTDEDTIRALISAYPDHRPVLEELLTWKGLQKLRSTYANGLLSASHRWSDGRVHFNWNITGTWPGRMSSSDPNGQNIPSTAREAFIPDTGNLFFAADYAQLELRVAAHLSQDPKMLATFQQGISPHKITFEEVFGFTDKHAHPKEYTLSKNLNFGSIYEVGPAAFVAQARQGGIEITEAYARERLLGHRANHPRFWEWKAEDRAFVRETGYTETLQGKRTYYPGVWSDDESEREEAYRQANNGRIQGTAGQLAKEAMVRIARMGLGSLLNFNVHDEIVGQNRADVAENSCAILMRVMREVGEKWITTVPIETEGNTAATWKELK